MLARGVSLEILRWKEVIAACAFLTVCGLLPAQSASSESHATRIFQG